MSFPILPSDHIHFMNDLHSQNESTCEKLCNQLQDEPITHEDVKEKLSFLNELEKSSSDPHVHAEIKIINDLLNESSSPFEPTSAKTDELINALQRLPL